MIRLLGVLLTLSVFASELEDTGIHGLQWKSGPIRVTREFRLGTHQITLSGFFKRPGWKLYLGDYEIPLNEKDEFRITIPVQFNNIRAEFIAKDGKRGLENEFVELHLNGYFEERTRDERRFTKRNWFEKQFSDMSLNLGLGTSLLSYNQTSLPVVSQMGFTPKVDWIYVFAQNQYSLEGSAYTSLFSSLKLMGADARLGWELPLEEGRLAFYLFGGFYYTTSFGSDTMGYSGIWGPLIYPALRATFKNGSSISLYGKYSPILNGYVPMTLDNASASLGLSYYFKPFSGAKLKGVPFGLSLEATRLRLGLEGGSLLVTTYTLSGNLLF